MKVNESIKFYFEQAFKDRSLILSGVGFALFIVLDIFLIILILFLAILPGKENNNFKNKS